MRGVRAGLPVNDTLRIIANEAQEPVKSEFRRVVEQQALGVPVSEALQKMALDRAFNPPPATKSAAHPNATAAGGPRE